MLDLIVFNIFGKEIDYVLCQVYFGGIDYQVMVDLKLLVLVNGQGSYYLIMVNIGGKYGGYMFFNVSVIYQVNDKLSLELQLKNLVNCYYEYVWINDQIWYVLGDGWVVYFFVNVKY